ncbi:MAG: ATP-binding cassette domain-containing protein, partial [Candidatus Eiseniibacteriota bacterium]
VLENVRIAVQARHDPGFDIWSLATRRRDLIEMAEPHLSRTGLLDRMDAQTAALSHGDQRKLEVAVLLALEAEVLMFDEPTAGMSVDEVPVVLDLIHEIKADTSKTVLLVEHKMDVVRSLADRIIVLHNGALVADGAPETVIASDIVQQAYLGTAGTGGGHG